MGSPPKKHTSVRQRRNKASTKATLTVPAEAFIPGLPEQFDAKGELVPWREETLEWWDDVWSSPMSNEFVDADFHGLFRLAMLVDVFYCDPTSKNHAEVRIAQQAYGLTPYDRRRLEWTVEQTEDAKERGAQRRRMAQAPQHAPHEDPRLRIVE
jgi:hypothetical protein